MEGVTNNLYRMKKHLKVKSKEVDIQVLKVAIDLSRLDGNAFALMSAFSRQAKIQGYTKSQVDKVLKEATSGDYDNLLRVLIRNTI